MRVAVTGAGGAIGGHLVARLLSEGHEVRGADIKPRDGWWQWHRDAWNLPGADCSDPAVAARAVDGAEWVFDLSENMGGIGFIESHRVDCAESVRIGMSLAAAAAAAGAARFFFASSACVYPTHLQDDATGRALAESDAWPARPESGYGLCKLYMEEVCRHYRDERGLETRVARYHNIYGPWSSWGDGREKAPAAICRKVATAKLTGSEHVEIWGDGYQARSYCWVEDCVEGTLRLMGSDRAEPLNVGSEETVTVNQLVSLVERVAGVGRLTRHYVPGAVGVRGRSSDNRLCREVLGWEPSTRLADGIARLYPWVEDQVRASL